MSAVVREILAVVREILAVVREILAVVSCFICTYLVDNTISSLFLSFFRVS